MKKFKCPFCDEVTTELEGMHEHIEEEHETNLPSNVTINEFYYSCRTGKTHGNCVMCKRPTKWNTNTNKYNRFCGREECKEQYVAEVRKRMVGKYGKTTLLNEPEHQKKMLKNRSISGTYKWSDGKHETDYTGSYELDFLKYLDLFLEFDPNDVLMPSPHTYYYEYEGKQHFYIPDAFIPSLNLEIEIKDGGDNPNMHHKIQDVDKVKERLKDEVMTSQKTRSYVKILNKDYSTFVQFLLMKKDEFSENRNSSKPIFILKKEKTYTVEDVKENALLESTSSFSTKLLENQQRITAYLDKIHDCEKMVDFTGFEGQLGFKPFIFTLNCCGRTDITSLMNYSDMGTLYDPYGIYNDTIHDSLGNYISDVIDGADDYINDSLTKVYSSIDIMLAMDNKNVDMLVLRDMYSLILCLQTLMNHTNIYNYKLRVLYSSIIEDYIPALERKVFVEPTFDVDMTLESVLLEVSSDLDAVEESFKSSKSNRMYHPVYVLLTHTGTVLSNTIKSITANPYSHSSISFSPELDEMYSFGRKYKSNPLIGTFVKENIKEGLFEDVSETATYSLYVTFVDELSYRKMKKRLEEFKDPKKKFRYNFVGLIKHQMGIASTSTDAYFCSQFVDTILSENEIDFFAQDSSLVKPYDFAKHDAFLHVSRGKLKNYDVDKVKAKVKQLEFDHRNVMESTDLNFRNAPVSESFINSNKNYEFRYDDWKENGGVLIVTGASGSGKSTLASKLSKKYRVHHYELDALVFDVKGNRETAKLKKDIMNYSPKVEKMINSNTKDVDDINFITTEVLKYLKDNIGSGRVIVDTHFTYDAGTVKFITDNMIPTIITRTDDLTSSIRATKRDIGYSTNYFKRIPDTIKGVKNLYEYNKSVSGEFTKMIDKLDSVTL